jgi:hypothetical protein
MLHSSKSHISVFVRGVISRNIRCRLFATMCVCILLIGQAFAQTQLAYLMRLTFNVSS